MPKGKKDQKDQEEAKGAKKDKVEANSKKDKAKGKKDKSPSPDKDTKKTKTGKVDAGKKSKDKEKDPAKPKKVMTSFMAYGNQVRPGIMSSNPDKKITEIAKIIGDQWNKMSDDDKKEYDKYVVEDRKRFDEQTKMYKDKGYYF